MVICETGTVHTFRVYLPEATSVELVGTFSQWRAHALAMRREHTGWWTVTAELAPGDHEFCYLVDGSHWVADYAAMGVRRNPFGGWTSQLHVNDPLPAVVRPIRSVGIARAVAA